MSVEETRSIDLISKAENPARSQLIILDHLPWSTPGHLRMLQDKINAYFDFADSGEAFDRFPDLRDLPVWIDVRFIYPPSDEALQFLKKAKGLAEADGVEFSWEEIEQKAEPNQTARDNARDVT